MTLAAGPQVLERRALARKSLRRLLDRYTVELVDVPDGESIPGSYWGDPEAGLIGNRLYVRDDTPAHSVLHELAHYVCMSVPRRTTLDTDAGGDSDEECAVCYLQVLLAEELPDFGRARCLSDMDAWGYSFRQGSAGAWFCGDGRDARRWLATRGLIDGDDNPTYSLVGFGASP